MYHEKVSKECKESISATENIFKNFKIGEVFQGKVTKVFKFSAFLELTSGREGFCHISQLDTKRVEKIYNSYNYVKIGDTNL